MRQQAAVWSLPQGPAFLREALLLYHHVSHLALQTPSRFKNLHTATLWLRGQSLRRAVGMWLGNAATSHTQEVTISFRLDRWECGLGGRRALGTVDISHKWGRWGAYDGVEIGTHDVWQRRHGKGSLLRTRLPGAPGITCEEVRGQRGRGARATWYGRAGHGRARAQAELHASLAGLVGAWRWPQRRKHTVAIWPVMSATKHWLCFKQT